MTRTAAILLVLALIGFAPAAVAAETDAEEEQNADPKPEAKSSVTQHQIEIDGETVNYTATAGWLILENDKEEAIARFGYTAYITGWHRGPQPPPDHVRLQRRAGIVVDLAPHGCFGSAAGCGRGRRLRSASAGEACGQRIQHH
jgi:hypothetical protein